MNDGDMFIVSAVNVFPSDIEAVVRDIPEITGEYLVRVYLVRVYEEGCLFSYIVVIRDIITPIRKT